MSLEDDDFERMLLRAGRRARAPSGMRTRALAAAASVLSLAPPAGASLAPAKPASAFTKSGSGLLRLATSKWSVMAVLAGAVTSGPAFDPPAVPHAAPIASAASALVFAPPPSVASSPPPPSVAPSPSVVDERPQSPELSTSRKVAPAPEVPNIRTPAASTRRLISREVPHDLGQEVALVDTARHALARGDCSAAISRAEEHERRFPAGVLVLEREVVRIDALEQSGRHDEASARARAFVTRYPAATQALRMREVGRADGKKR